MFDTSSARQAVAVTPSDSTALHETRGLYIGTSGDVAVQIGTATVTFKSVPVGFMPVAVTKVMNTNTTASNILALY
jgi:hypothetical protein